jgi:hypothetical protein
MDFFSKYIGKEAIYFEKKIAKHVTIYNIKLNPDTLTVTLKPNKTPGFHFIDNEMFSVCSVIGVLSIYKNIIKALNIWDLFLIKDIDDFFETYPTLNNRIDIDQEFSERNFKHILETTKRIFVTQKIFPDICKAYRSKESEHIVKIADDIFMDHLDEYVKFPKESLNFMPDTIRDQKFFEYSEQQIKQLKDAGITPDKRSNGPAIMSYLLAGGERPDRACGKQKWSIHHIYDGKYPYPGKNETTHAVKDPRYFAQSDGLVAIHSIADGLVDECPYFAWSLRCHAYLIFLFDPDNVFDWCKKNSVIFPKV